MRKPFFLGVGFKIGLLASLMVGLTGLPIAMWLITKDNDVLIEHELIDLDGDTRLKSAQFMGHYRDIPRELLEISKSLGKIVAGTAATDVEGGEALESAILGELDKHRGKLPDCVRATYIDFQGGGRSSAGLDWRAGTRSPHLRPEQVEECRADCVETARQSPLRVSRVHLSGIDPTAPLLHVAIPIDPAPEHRCLGVLCVVLDLRLLARRLEAKTPRNLLWLTDQKGRILVPPRGMEDRIHAGDRLQNLPEFLAPGGSLEPPGNWFTRGEDGSLSIPLRVPEKWHEEKAFQATYKPAAPIFLVKIEINDPSKVSDRAFESLHESLRAAQEKHKRDILISSPKEVRLEYPTTYLRGSDQSLLTRVAREIRDGSPGIDLTVRRPFECGSFDLRFVRMPIDPLDDKDRFLGLAMAMSQDELRSEFAQERGPIEAVALALSVLALVIAFACAQYLMHPLRRITAAAESLARGEYDVTLPTRSRDEVGVLARTFRAMADQVRDRTERLDEALTRTQTILDIAADGILTIDREGKVGSFNRAACDIFGYAADEVIGRNVHLLLDETSRDAADPGTFAHLMSLEPALVLAHKHELVGRRKDGSAFPIEIAVGMHRYQDDRRLLTITVRDITERRELELERERRKDELERAVLDRTADLERTNDQLKVAKDTAEAAMKTQEIFLSGVAHDLRTPLASVIGYSEDLLDQASESGLDDLLPDLKMIVNQGRYLNELVNDLLSLNEALSGKGIVLDLKEFDVKEMLRARKEGMIDYLARKHEDRFVLDCPDDLGKMVGDEVRIWRVLINLLSNAFKNTRGGTVTLSVRRERDRAGDWFVFRVSDTGRGMGFEQLGKLYQRFETGQAGGGLERGFGLGLSICRLYCKDAMGGDLEVESELGRGSTFTARLPSGGRGPSDRPQPHRLEPHPTAPREDRNEANMVLIIDDDAASRELMERRLARDGFRTLSASDGEQGLRLAKELLPSAIILDVVMPGIDGWAVLAALKTDTATSEIPVIMATMLDDRERGYDLGADEFLNKPFSRDSLAGLIHKHTDARRPVRILVVEDDPEARSTICRTLRDQRWDVDEASDAPQALELIASRRPDLILLDLLLPQVDGFELIDQIRREKAWRDISIVVVTGVQLDSEARRRLQGQVEQILGKGFLDRRELLRHIRALIASSTAQRADRPTEMPDAEGTLHRG